MQTMQTIGTCSICGGPVTIPVVWGGVIPPVPTCEHCGATAQNSYGPIIPMQNNKTYKTTSYNSSGSNFYKLQQ